MNIVIHRKIAQIVFGLTCGMAIPCCSAIGQTDSRRLTVRLHEIQSAPQVVKAGEYTLDSINRGLVYVPQQGLGPARVPLVVTLTGGGVNARREMDFVRSLSDKYGMILLVLDHPSPAILNDALKQVLTKFSIDPDKIAITGVSEGGFGALAFGRSNQDMFNRIAPMSSAGIPDYPDSVATEKNTKIFVSVGIGEPSRMVGGLIMIAAQERARGRSVKSVLNMRFHANRLEDQDYMWRWLRDSWATPHGDLSTPSSGDDIVLTEEVLDKMSKFWLDVGAKKKDSTYRAVIAAHQKELPLLVGEERVFSYDMVDMPTLVLTQKWIATALNDAGLTAEKEELYRRAFVGARATKVVRSAIKSLPDNSVSARNVVFIETHQQRVNALLDAMGVPRCETTIQVHFGC